MTQDMFPKQLEDAFYNGNRSDTLPYCLNDVLEVTAGEYQGRRGWAVAVDRRKPELRLLIEFDDGTDELVPLSQLTRIKNAG